MFFDVRDTSLITDRSSPSISLPISVCRRLSRSISFHPSIYLDLSLDLSRSISTYLLIRLDPPLDLSRSISIYLDPSRSTPAHLRLLSRSLVLLLSFRAAFVCKIYCQISYYTADINARDRPSCERQGLFCFLHTIRLVSLLLGGGQ